MAATVNYGLQFAIFGVSVLFVGVIVLIILVARMSSRVRSLTGGEDAGAMPAPAVPAAIPVATPVAAQLVDDDQEIVAVITAAVAALMGTSANGIAVRSIRRVGASAPSWNVAGRSDIINTRN